MLWHRRWVAYKAHNQVNFSDDGKPEVHFPFDFSFLFAPQGLTNYLPSTSVVQAHCQFTWFK